MFDCYLKISNPDLRGESIDKAHAGQIPVHAFQLGASNPSDISSGSAAGKVQVSTFQITKRTDKASPLLFQACCEGDAFGQAVCTLVRKAAGKALVYLIYTFTEVHVDSIQWTGVSADKDDMPTEIVNFSFGSVHIKYVPQNADGSGGPAIEGGWDIEQHVPR